MKQRIKSLLYIPRHEKPTDENIGRLMIPSFAGIVLCMVCLAGATWAWFTASVSTPTQKIQAANYIINTSVTALDGTAAEAEDGVYHLEADTKYTVDLTAVGTANTGYCKIILNCGDTEKIYYTPQFPSVSDPSEEFKFTVSVSEKTQMTVVPSWGTYAVEGGDKTVIGSDGIDLTSSRKPGNSEKPDETDNSGETAVGGQTVPPEGSSDTPGATDSSVSEPEEISSSAESADENPSSKTSLPEETDG